MTVGGSAKTWSFGLTVMAKIPAYLIELPAFPYVSPPTSPYVSPYWMSTQAVDRLWFSACTDYHGGHIQQQHNGMPHHPGMPHQTMMPTGTFHPGTPGTVHQPMMGRKRPNSAPGGSSMPRTRVEGRRCEVCAVIKKAGCGTDNAHFRCLKRKRPEGSQVGVTSV